MKKTYTKPIVIIEDLTLSQSVAHNCGEGLVFEQATLKYKSQCGWDLMEDGEVGTGDDILWVAQPTCTRLVSEDSIDYGYCYNNPDGGMNIFNS